MKTTKHYYAINSLEEFEQTFDISKKLQKLNEIGDVMDMKYSTAGSWERNTWESMLGINQWDKNYYGR